MEHQTPRRFAVLGAVFGAVLLAASGASAQAAGGAESLPPPAWQKQAAAPAPAPTPAARKEYDGPPLLFGKDKSIGGYAGPTIAYTHMLGTDGTLVGFEGALLIAHRLSLGLAGFGFTRTPGGPADVYGIPRDFGTGYGGFVGRYALFTSSPVYASLGMLIGGGAVVLHRAWDPDGEHDDEDYADEAEVDGFFLVQPEFSLHMNVTRWMRLGLSVGYRATSGVQRHGLTESDLNGVVAGGSMQFGWI